MLLSVIELIGHFHPVLVHLPIGILLIACFLLLKSGKEKHAQLRPAVNVLFFWGMITAVASCISGYFLSQSGDYDEELVSVHQWAGITVAGVSVLIYFIVRASQYARWHWIFAVVMILLVMATGHLGGSLTHGSDYLTAPLDNLGAPDSSQSEVKRKPINDVQEAQVYNDLVQPIFQAKCYGCHGATKQKGKLRVDQPELLMKGGKNGEVIDSGNAMESELIKRLLLPREEEHHMPPKEKSQLNDQQVSLLHWWIDGGADFNKKVKDYTQPEKIRQVLLSFQSGHEEKKRASDVPAAPVEEANANHISKLKSSGVIVMPVARNSNYLLVNFLTADSAVSDADMELLLPLQKQLVWLDAGNTHIGDSAMNRIARCSGLTKLQLDHTNITDIGLSRLAALGNLQSLNLVGTKVTKAGMMALKELKNLRSVFLYQTNIRKEDTAVLKKTFPAASLDFGGYVVPFMETDTMIERPKPVKQ